MEIENKTDKAKYRQIVPLVLIGIGLIIIGVVVGSTLVKNRLTSEWSVVPAAVNFPAPELKLNDLDGNIISLSDYRQQVVLINNWAIWCPPCKDEMPALLKYYQDHSDQGFVVLGIEAGDSKNQVAGFVDEYQLTFPILLDPNNKSLIAFHNDSLPSSYLVDREGNVVLAWTGPISRNMLEKFVTPLLEQ
jgi:cytochrome c biogenesis protein CcmG, thiol:disulfide interchange protein DsbE